MTLEYITTRELENNGKIRVVKMKEDANATIDLTCPGCGASDKKNEKWEEPFLTGTGANQKFAVTCSKCGFQVKMLKLKKEMKKK